MSAASDDMNVLRQQWTELYSKTLPSLACARHQAQAKWPVTLDHCFARIILDNTVGRGTLPWDNVIKRPAVKNMNVSQIKEAINLAKKIEAGDVDLVELDWISLSARGKRNKKYDEDDAVITAHTSPTAVSAAAGVKRSPRTLPKSMKDGGDSQISQHATKRHKPNSSGRTQSTLSFSESCQRDMKPMQSTSHASEAGLAEPSDTVDDIPRYLNLLANDDNMTPYRKRLYSTLLSVPRGRYTTYAAMSNYLNSSARAVGNGMRNNPFAPGVPCHRVLAADGTIGGFKGSWGKDGIYARHKVELLKSEGVHFDSKGKVKGPVFTDLEDLSAVNVKA